MTANEQCTYQHSVVQSVYLTSYVIMVHNLPGASQNQAKHQQPLQEEVVAHAVPHHRQGNQSS